jgi:2-iminobutanoate/2-iminopropanoate deaminase
MQTRAINAADGPTPAGAYTQAIEVSGATRTLYVSGQIGVDAAGRLAAGAEAQVRQACANLVAQLRAAGMTLDNVVKIVTIVPDRADLPTVRTVRTEVFGDRRPASTLIVGGLASADWKVEIEAIACA